jgi:hypothetical protein
MITPILVVATICATGAAFLFRAKYKESKEELNDLETTYGRIIDKYADGLVENHSLKAELAKLKRKPRKDKGQPRKSYNGKPVTRKHKSNKGE